MGAVFEVAPNGKYVSTGKYPHPAGELHEPVWGPWSNEGYGMKMRQCHWTPHGGPDDGSGCDVDDWAKL